ALVPGIHAGPGCLDLGPRPQLPRGDDRLADVAEDGGAPAGPSGGGDGPHLARLRDRPGLLPRPRHLPVHHVVGDPRRPRHREAGRHPGHGPVLRPGPGQVLAGAGGAGAVVPVVHRRQPNHRRGGVGHHGGLGPRQRPVLVPPLGDRIRHRPGRGGAVRGVDGDDHLLRLAGAERGLRPGVDGPGPGTHGRERPAGSPSCGRRPVQAGVAGIPMRSEPPSPEEILAQIAAELAEPQYRMGTPWWERVIEWLTRAWIVFVEWLTEISDLVGGPLVLASIVAVVLGGAIAAITVNLGRRRARRIDERLRREHEAVRGLDPVDLDRRAAEAESRGDYATALRLAFQAGLIRLDRAGLIDLRPGTTSGTVAEALGSAEFAALVERFDAV